MSDADSRRILIEPSNYVLGVGADSQKRAEENEPIRTNALCSALKPLQIYIKDGVFAASPWFPCPDRTLLPGWRRSPRREGRS